MISRDITDKRYNLMSLLFPEEANNYDHSQHFLYARLKKKYAGPEELTDHYHNLGAIFSANFHAPQIDLLRRRGRQQ